MAVAAQESIAALRDGFNRLSSSRKVLLMVSVAAAVAIVVGLWMWSQAPDYRVLYSNLSDRDGGTIIEALQKMNVPYKIAEGGGSILVPAQQVYDVRLRLASQGLPRGGNVGFELMENQKLGTSQFLEQVNYQRALEGELARSIESLSAVQAARVHLAIPRPSVFVREQQKPSASVVLRLFPGRVLDPGQVNGIVHLVASSVSDLSARNVTIVDQAGNLLSTVARSAALGGLDSSQLDYLHQVEQSYAKRIQSILSPITGPDNVRAQVTADLNFAQTEQTAEIYKPNSSPADAAIRSQQSVETIGGGGQPATGVPGALSNQPPGAASAPLTAIAGAPQNQGAGGTGSASNMHKESTINYEVDKTIRHVRMPVGTIKRLSVAVVVNFKRITDKNGKVSYKPWSPQEIGQINNLVKEAMGYSAQRGDSLQVVNASFTPERDEMELVPAWKAPENLALVKEILKNLLIVGVALFLVFSIFRPLLREFAPARVEPGMEPGEAAVPVESAEADVAQLLAAGYEENLKVAKEIAKREPVIIANVVKEWVENA